MARNNLPKSDPKKNRENQENLLLFDFSDSESSENSAENSRENSENYKTKNSENSQKIKTEIRENYETKKCQIAEKTENKEENFAKNYSENCENPAEILPEFSVSEAIALFNQMFETAAPRLKIVGEIANYKVSQGKWIFFDIKDADGNLNCFLSVFNLRTEIENGMKVAITARPKFTKWGKFSLTVEQISPLGEGAILRAFELLREKLAAEGIFAPERKRALPKIPQKIGVISSENAAGYKDFLKILENRFSGLEVLLFPAQVQGDVAANQIIAGLEFFNSMQNPPDVIAILRGGGSRDDLVAFDDEKLVRAVASSRVPTIAGIGHEIDVTLVDLAADVRASTPSNAAEILIPDKRELMANVEFRVKNLLEEISRKVDCTQEETREKLSDALEKIQQIYSDDERRFLRNFAILEQLNPAKILRRGFAIAKNNRGEILREKMPNSGEKLTIETAKFIIETEVKNVREK